MGMKNTSQKTDSSQNETEFSVCANDPLIRLFARYDLGPVWLSVGFLILAALFTAWLWYCYPELNEFNKYLTYTENVSWFLSLIFIFPFVLGLIYKYYLDIPQATVNTYEKLGDDAAVANFAAYWSDKFKKIDHPGIVVLVIVLSIVGNEAYFVKIYLNEPANSWMVQESIEGNYDFSVTAAGWVAVLIQTFLTYWIITFAIKGFLYIRYLHEFFSIHRKDINVNTMHADGLSGLSEIARLATWQSTILLLMGIYVSLKVIDKSYFQEASVIADPGNMAVLISYVLLAPLMFFMLLGATHGVMRDAKQRFLDKFNKDSVLLHETLISTNDLKSKNELLALIQKELECRDLFDQKIRVWPFTLRSIQGFFGAVISPLLPVFITLIKWLLDKVAAGG